MDIFVNAFVTGFLIGLLYSPIIEFITGFLRGIKNRIEAKEVAKLFLNENLEALNEIGKRNK